MAVHPPNKIQCTALSRCGISNKPPEGIEEPGRHNNTWMATPQATAQKGLRNKRFITNFFLLN